MRFQIDRSVLALPLLAALGGTAKGSYLELTDDELHCKFGFLFDEAIPLSAIEGVEANVRWPWYDGVGWRTNFRGRVGLVGTLRNIVCIKVAPGRKAHLFLPLPLRKLYVSLEDGEGFVAALREKLAARRQPGQAS